MGRVGGGAMPREVRLQDLPPNHLLVESASSTGARDQARVTEEESGEPKEVSGRPAE